MPVFVLLLINQYSDSYSCNNQVLVLGLGLTHIASTHTCTSTRKSGTRPSPGLDPGDWTTHTQYICYPTWTALLIPNTPDIQHGRDYSYPIHLISNMDGTTHTQYIWWCIEYELSSTCWISLSSWWRNQMETFSVLLAFCAGNSPHKGQWRGALMFSLICAWINGWINNHEAGDLGRHRAHYDFIVMYWLLQGSSPHFGKDHTPDTVPNKIISWNPLIISVA